MGRLDLSISQGRMSVGYVILLDLSQYLFILTLSKGFDQMTSKCAFQPLLFFNSRNLICSKTKSSIILQTKQKFVVEENPPFYTISYSVSDSFLQTPQSRVDGIFLNGNSMIQHKGREDWCRFYRDVQIKWLIQTTKKAQCRLKRTLPEKVPIQTTDYTTSCKSYYCSEKCSEPEEQTDLPDVPVLFPHRGYIPQKS